MKSFKAFMFFTFLCAMLNVTSSDNSVFASVNINKFLNIPDIRFNKFVPDLNLNKLITPQFERRFANVRNYFTNMHPIVDYKKKANNEIYPTQFTNQNYFASHEQTKEKFKKNKKDYLNEQSDVFDKDNIIKNQEMTESTEVTTDTSTTNLEMTTDYDGDDIMTRLSSSAVASLLG